MRYTVARYQEDLKLHSYRVYVTNALQMIAQGNKYPSQSWHEIIKPTPQIDADKVIQDTIEKAGLVVV